MTIYTEKPDASLPRPLSNLQAGLLESAGAAFMTGLDDGLLFSAIDIAKAKRLQADENAPVISKNDVNTEFKKMGITSIDVPEQGLTQTYFDHVIAERKKSLQRQEILAAAPDGWIATPLRFLAHMAGNMVDPGDLALNAIPLLGPAKAATRLGRAAERFGKGAAVGGATTAAEIPVIGTGAAARGDDYGYESAVQSVLFGAVAGGVLNAGGGLIADIVGQRRARQNANAQAEHQENDAYARAYDDVMPEFVAQQHTNLNGKVADIEAVQAEISQHHQQISALDSADDAGDTVGRLKQREANLRQVTAHTAAEEAETHLAALQSGTLPDALKTQIAQRAQAILHKMQATDFSQPSAAQRLAEADNAIRKGAMRAAIAQAQRGEAINVNPFLDLMVPTKRKAALEALARVKPLDRAPPVQPSLNTAPLQRTEKAIAETDNVKADLETELNRLEAQVQQHSDPVLASEIKALRDEVNDTSLHNAIQAAAVCMVRKSS